MLALRLPPEVEKRLEALAVKSGRSTASHAEEAILAYLEDVEDAALVRQRLEANEERVSLERLMKELETEPDA